MLNKKIVFLPIITALVFLVFSEVLLLFGPIQYEITNYSTLYLYLFLLNFVLFIGYLKGVHDFKQSVFLFKNGILEMMLILGILLTFRQLVNRWYERGLALSMDDLMMALHNSGEVYKGKIFKDTSSSLWILLTPFRWAAIPLGLGNWKKLNNFFKIVIFLTIVMEILTWIGMGTRKGLYDVIILLFFFIIAISPNIILLPKNRRILLSIAGGVFIIFLLYFIISNASRYGYLANDINNIVLWHKIIRPFYEKLPVWLTFSLIQINGYLCQGYYALSKGLELGVRPITFGGSGWFTIMLMNKLGYDPEPNIYMAVLEQYGIHRHINWHTIYLWLANDVTFYGVPILIFFIGYLLAITWQDVLTGENQSAYPLFALMLIMVFYFYANKES